MADNKLYYGDAVRQAGGREAAATLASQVLLVLFGWLLGLLGGPVSEYIRRRHRRAELLKAVRAELRECRHLMASLAYRLRSQLGEIDHSFLDWMLPIDRERAEATGGTTTVAAVERLRKMPAAELAANQKNKVRAGVSLTLKTYSLPLIESAIPELVLFPPNLRREILAIREQLDLLNQDVPPLTTLHERTFDASLQLPNRMIVVSNLEDGYWQMARRAKNIADRITAILD